MAPAGNLPEGDGNGKKKLVHATATELMAVMSNDDDGMATMVNAMTLARTMRC